MYKKQTKSRRLFSKWIKAIVTFCRASVGMRVSGVWVGGGCWRVWGECVGWVACVFCFCLSVFFFFFSIFVLSFRVAFCHFLNMLKAHIWSVLAYTTMRKDSFNRDLGQSPTSRPLQTIGRRFTWSSSTNIWFVIGCKMAIDVWLSKTPSKTLQILVLSSTLLSSPVLLSQNSRKRGGSRFDYISIASV